MDESSVSARKTRAILSWVVGLAAGALGTWAYHRAEFMSGFELFFGGRGDPRFITYICEHWYQTLDGRATLLSPGMFYPVTGTLGYSDLVVGYALPYALLRALGLEMFSAMQAVIILFNFLSFLSCFFLLHRVLRLDLLASCAAALFFAFSSPKLAQFGHLQMQFTFLLPLLFTFLILFARPASARTRSQAAALLGLAVLAFHLQLLTTFYYAWFFALWCLLFIAVSLLFGETRRLLRALIFRPRPALSRAGAAVVVLLALAGIVPFLAVYLPVARSTGGYGYPTIVALIPAARDFLRMGPGNLVWRRLSAAMRESAPPGGLGELRVGLGLIPTLAWIVLTLIAIAAAVRYFRSGAAAAAAKRTAADGEEIAGWAADAHTGELFVIATVLATTLFFLIGMKYGGASPWYFVHHLVPGGTAIRAVARYVLFLTLPMALVFAWAIDRTMHWAASRPTRVGAVSSGLAILFVAYTGVAEQFGSHRGFSKAREQAYMKELAAELEPDCEAFYLAPPRKPTASVAAYQYDAMMVSSVSGIPTLNGLSSLFPPDWGLYQIDHPGYEDAVRDWIARQRIEGKVCRLVP